MFKIGDLVILKSEETYACCKASSYYVGTIGKVIKEYQDGDDLIGVGFPKHELDTLVIGEEADHYFKSEDLELVFTV